MKRLSPHYLNDCEKLNTPQDLCSMRCSIAKVVVMDMAQLAFAVAPGAFLFAFCCDRRNVRRSVIVLSKLFLLGAAAGIVAGIVENMVEGCFVARIAQAGFAHDLMKGFVVAGLIEELVKFSVLHARTWKRDCANDELDAIRCAAAISLGFATLENLLYFAFVLNGSVSAMGVRTLFSVPGHAMYGVFMGWFYGKAKMAGIEGRLSSCRVYKVLAVAVPVLAHGMFDYLCFSRNALGVFAVQTVYVVVTFLCIKRARKLR